MNTDKSINPKCTITDIIETLEKELQEYQRKNKASQFYIDKQKKLIADLTEISNSLKSQRFYDVFTIIQNEMNKIEMNDSELSGHIIHIRLKPTGNNFSIININPFKL